jgi:hypothetical protein
MNEFELKLHRTWLELLVSSNLREAASLVVGAELSLLQGPWEVCGVNIDLPPASFGYIEADGSLKKILEQTLKLVSRGHFHDQNGDPLKDIQVEFRIKLLELEDNWLEVIKEQIVNAKDSNQGLISEKVFARNRKQVFQYNELKFASQSEIRIAQELEKKGVLFFPLAVAVRSDTGKLFEDHREVDFLICQNGIWGILEVSYHPDRFEKDSEKDYWFKKSGILCIQHYTAERCFTNSGAVVDEFLGILKKYK